MITNTEHIKCTNNKDSGFSIQESLLLLDKLERINNKVNLYTKYKDNDNY